MIFYCAFIWKTRGPLAEPVEHATGAARRRLERRSRQFLRHERLTVAMALAAAVHHTAPRGQRRARGRGVEREENYEPRLQNPPLSQAASTEYFTLDDDEEMLAEGCRPPQGKDARRPGDYCPHLKPAPCMVDRADDSGGEEEAGGGQGDDDCVDQAHEGGKGAKERGDVLVPQQRRAPDIQVPPLQVQSVEQIVDVRVPQSSRRDPRRVLLRQCHRSWEVCGRCQVHTTGGCAGRRNLLR